MPATARPRTSTPIRTVEPVRPALAGAPRDPAALLALLTFLSPAFPVGAFSYSHGLEWRIDSGAIREAAALEAWLADLLAVGSGWNDAVLFAAAHRAASGGDTHVLRETAELGEALAGSRERLLETTAQGGAFLTAVAAAWSGPALSALSSAGAPFPVAVAAACADQRIPLAVALPAYLNAFTANLVSVAVRLVPLGQSAGLRTLAALHPLIAGTAERAVRSTLDDLGAATILSDIAAMRHETQYSRVFRT